jgi:uncharacterized protein
VAERNRRAIAFAAFFAIVLTITVLCWLLVGVFVAGLLPGGWWTFWIAWAASIAPLGVIVRNMTSGGYPRAFVRVYAFRVFWYAQLLMLALAPIAAVVALVALPFGFGAQAGRYAVVTLAPLLVLFALWGYVGTRRLVVRELEFSPARMPRALDGLRIVQLSDLHVGPHTSRAHLARIAAATQAARPDIIAYTGDQVDDYPRDVEPLASALGHLSAPLGRFAIAGNHDVYAGWPDVERRLEAMGLTVLVNRAMPLERNGQHFWIAGTGDPAALQMPASDPNGHPARPDIAQTLRDVPAGAFCVVLAHNPALWPALAERGVPLTLSGHTHYGQFAIPSKNWSLASVFLELAMGVHERGNSILYINPGTNYWGIPLRVGALPEVTVVTLRSRDNGSARE